MTIRTTTSILLAISLAACSGQSQEEKQERDSSLYAQQDEILTEKCRNAAGNVTWYALQHGLKDFDRQAGFLAYDCSGRSWDNANDSCTIDKYDIAVRIALLSTGSGDQWSRQSLVSDLVKYKKECPSAS